MGGSIQGGERWGGGGRGRCVCGVAAGAGGEGGGGGGARRHRRMGRRERAERAFSRRRIWRGCGVLVVDDEMRCAGNGVAAVFGGI